MLGVDIYSSTSLNLTIKILISVRFPRSLKKGKKKLGIYKIYCPPTASIALMSILHTKNTFFLTRKTSISNRHYLLLRKYANSGNISKDYTDKYRPCSRFINMYRIYYHFQSKKPINKGIFNLFSLTSPVNLITEYSNHLIDIHGEIN